TGRESESMRPLVIDTAHQLIDNVEQKPSVDLVAECAFPFPMQIICKMMDVDIGDAGTLGMAVSKIAKVFDPSPMSADE
ncbi:cytochrome P450, partial [Xylella fastidiosa subsp. multiplex]|nr:cytochrome P450 [Xylella fastidiosa subsp. multiplex]